MKRLLFFFALFFFHYAVSAQAILQKRIEFELNDNFSDEKIFEFGEEGLIIRSVSNKSINKQREWKFELYDTDLERTEGRSIQLRKELFPEKSFRTSDHVHTFFKDRKGAYALFSISVAEMELTRVEGFLPKKAVVEKMVIMGEYAFFSASIKGQPYLFSINWKNGRHQLVPINIGGYKNNRIRVINIQVFEEQQEIMVFVRASRKKESEVWVLRLNERGEKRDLFSFSKEVDQQIVGISANKLNDSEYLMSGTYSQYNGQSSVGMFFCKLNDQKVAYIRYYNFLELDNFLNYLPKKRQEKIEKKKAKKQAKGKDFSINYFIANHNIMEADGSYLFLGEAYYPTYRSEARTTYNANGQPITTTVRVFDGYAYTHAILARFDVDGKLEWDQTFELKQTYKPLFVKRFIQIMEESNSNSVDMIYASSNRLVSKSVGFDGEVLKDEDMDLIDSGDESDRTKHTFSNVNYWYGRYVLAFGTQKVINRAKPTDKKRKVFFINKYQF